MIEAEPVWRIRSELGEGPIWWDGSLYWLDITAPRLHIYTPATGARRSFDLAEQTGTAVPRASGGLVLAQETGLVAFDPQAGTADPLPWPAERRIVNRFNDGKCDPQGRLWVGTIGRDQPTASLYRVDADFTVTEMLSGLRVSNGLCWDPRRRRFYFIDSPTGAVDVFDWNPEAGSIHNRRSFARLPDGETGVPDGMTIDREGRLWVAVFGGFGVHCLDPDTGRSIEKIHVPVAKTTACWFGGDDLDELYITTASIREDAAALKARPLAGSLFMTRPGATGLPATACAL